MGHDGLELRCNDIRASYYPTKPPKRRSACAIIQAPASFFQSGSDAIMTGFAAFVNVARSALLQRGQRVNPIALTPD
jgi:hypothetical protein